MSTQDVIGNLFLIVPVLIAFLGPRRLRRLGRWVRARTQPWLSSRSVPWTRTRLAPVPCGRPIELIAQDAHRLGRRFRYVPRGASFARFEGSRCAYDRVLSEACAALGLEHLLAVIPPGPELDAERCRVESALEWAGMRLDDAA